MIQTMQVGVTTDIELPRSFVHYSTIVGAIPINVSFWGRKGFASMLSSWEKTISDYTFLSKRVTRL